MFEEEQDNKIYNLIITQGIDPENEYKDRESILKMNTRNLQLNYSQNQSFYGLKQLQEIILHFLKNSLKKWTSLLFYPAFTMKTRK